MAKGAAPVAPPPAPTLSDEQRLADRKKYLQRTQGLLKDTLFSTQNTTTPTEKAPQGLLGVYG
jgi:hypothetical protein